MTSAQITSVANQLIDGFDTTAHQVLDAWREGHERLGAAAKQRWDTAFAESKPQLSAETRKNATNAQKVFARYYDRGFELASGATTVAVDTMVQAARVAVARAANWQQERA